VSPRLEDELLEELTADGAEVTALRFIGVHSDGTETRGVLREAADLVRNLLVFSENELDEDTAKALVRLVFATLHRRRRSGEADDVRFVTIIGADGRSVLSTVPVPRRATDHLTE
jgi:hypothetical protein